MLQRWHVLDLTADTSLIKALTGAGIDTFALDWGELGDEPRLSFDEAIARVLRFARAARRLAGVSSLGLLGYSQGGTMASVCAALEPSLFDALVLIATPIDFSVHGAMSPLVDPRLVNADLLADAGGVPAATFRGLVAMMHPGATAFSAAAAKGHPNPGVRAHMDALERWADDSVPLPREVLRTWLGRLVQGNALVLGRLAIEGRRVSLDTIRARTMLVVADGDTICPPDSTLALARFIACQTLRVPGGHVSGVAGPGAGASVHQPVARWLVGEA